MYVREGHLGGEAEEEGAVGPWGGVVDWVRRAARKGGCEDWWNNNDPVQVDSDRPGFLHFSFLLPLPSIGACRLCQEPPSGSLSMER